MLLLAGLVGYNLVVYLPKRLGGMHGLYGISRDVIRGFLNAHVLPADGGEMSDVATIQPALIIVHSKTWHFYGALLELEDPFMTTPYVFAWNEESLDRYLPEDFPGRRVFHYYQEDPGVLYTRPKP
jgi:hypothetical protein